MFNKLKFLSLYYAFHLKKRFSPLAPTRPSATVLLVRDSAEGLEVFMVVRHHKIDFASGALVFPGGKVDPQDRAQGLRAFCDGAAETDDKTLSFQIAAIREVFEECGILLARKDGANALLNAEQVTALASYREALHKNKIDMQSFVTQENLRLACDQLHLFSHWVTPEMLPKRFDTHFYLVHAPDDQVGIHDGHESVDSVWISPQTALQDEKAGKRTIVFPTRLNLEKLGQSDTVQNAIQCLDASAAYEVMPKMRRKGIDVYLTLPEAAGYGNIEQLLSQVG
ncbi:MAG: NUDIX hydrolase [Candidatus Promineifilaceae bacterium]